MPRVVLFKIGKTMTLINRGYSIKREPHWTLPKSKPTKQTRQWVFHGRGADCWHFVGFLNSSCQQNFGISTE
jgi:hypothetical protein